MNNSLEPGVRSREYKRILIIRLDKIGDVLLSTPVIKAVRDAYPASYIAFMVQPYARDIVKGNPYLNEVIVYDKSGDEKSFIGNLRFLSRLRRDRFDLAIILHPNNRSHMLAFLAGIPVRIGYDRKLGILLTKRIPHTKQLGLKHERDYALDVVRYLGIEPKDKALYMPIDDNSEGKIKHLLGQNGIKESDLIIAVNPGASCPSKKWPLENYIKAVDELAAKYGAKIIIISGKKEKTLGDRLAESLKAKAINLAGRTTVSDLASVLKRSRILISNDSGPVHIACAVGTPVIAIFGRSDPGLSPARWAPTGVKDVVFHKDVGCGVCLAHDCRIGFKCLKAVTPEEVVEAAGKLLS